MSKKYMVNLHSIVSWYSFYHLCISIKKQYQQYKIIHSLISTTFQKDESIHTESDHTTYLKRR
jgi:hypothetical protein